MSAVAESATDRPAASRGRPQEVSALLVGALDPSGKSTLLTLAALAVASGLLAALTPLALKQLIDVMSAGDSPWGAALAYLLMLGLARIALDLRPLLTTVVDQAVQARLTLRLFDRLMRLPLGYLLRRRGGELLHSLDLGLAGAQVILSHVIGSAIPVLVELGTMVLVLQQLEQPALVAIFALTALAYAALLAHATPALGPWAQQVSKASMEVYAQLNDGITHVETLRSFSAERQAAGALSAATQALRARWLSFHRLNLGISLAASMLFTLSMGACLLVSARAVSVGTLTVGGFVLAGVYMLQLVRPLELLGTAARDLTRALGFMRPMAELLAEPLEPLEPLAPSDPLQPSSPEPSGQGLQGRASPRASPRIQFENLHFAYDPGHPVLQGLDLQIAPGHTTAVVGRSGSGKSTLAKLLLGLYRPQAGRILLDGQPLDSFSTTQLRALVGLVPQDTALLHTSVAANIALGLPQTTREEIEQAARRAQMHERILALPGGYDALVGERGLQLSGGERQRVAIARALLRRPALYILDEPSSMLDSRTEAEVLRALRELTAGHTVLVIAHRLSTVMQADAIVVLDEGRVAEQGTHQQLLARQGLYAQLWSQQLRGCDQS